MNPAARIATAVAASTVTLAGAGFALATVGQPSTASTETVVASPSSEPTDGPDLKVLARELSRLDDRSSRLAQLLAITQSRTQQVAAHNATAAASDDGESDGPSTPSPEPTRSSGDDEDDYYEDEYDDDRYDDDSDDDSRDDEHENEYEDEGHDD